MFGLRIRGDLIDARFVRRLNRFAALVEVHGREQLAHVPNSGRMRELLYPGALVLVAARPGPRKTPFDLLMVQHGPRLVSVDARLPIGLLEEALREGRLPELGQVESLRREVRVGDSRLDLRIDGPEGPGLIELKSVTLVREGVALFPDAPTTRGTRHLEELRRAADNGYRSTVAFVIQRDDPERFGPFEEADPLFASTLRSVSSCVRLFAYSCMVSRGEVTLHRQVPVDLFAAA